MNIDALSFLAGFGFAAILGLGLWRINKVRTRIGAHKTPQFIILRVERLPHEVEAEHFRAVVGVFLWGMLVIVILGGSGIFLLVSYF